MNLDRTFRLVGALGVLVGAGVHAYLYFNGYGPDDIPAPEAYVTDPGQFEVGRLFLANAGTGVLIALGLLFLKRRAADLFTILGIGWSIAVLAGFYVSRELDEGIFGYVENGFQPAPEAAISVGAEGVALVALAAALAASRVPDRRATAHMR